MGIVSGGSDTFIGALHRPAAFMGDKSKLGERTEYEKKFMTNPLDGYAL